MPKTPAETGKILSAISKTDYNKIKKILEDLGYSRSIVWSENLSPPINADDFAEAVIYVIANSGMLQSTGKKIADKVILALKKGKKVRSVFDKEGKIYKSAAMQQVWDERKELFTAFQESSDQIVWLERLKGIGPATKFHLARNLGFDFVKPDRWLLRLTTALKTTPDTLCWGLANRTGDRVGTVEMILWRALSKGIGILQISKTGVRLVPVSSAREKSVRKILREDY
jgi:hypothetical protein